MAPRGYRPDTIFFAILTEIKSEATDDIEDTEWHIGARSQDQAMTWSVQKLLLFNHHHRKRASSIHHYNQAKIL